MPPPAVQWTTGFGFRWYFIGSFVDNVARYPHVDDWIEVVW